MKSEGLTGHVREIGRNRWELTVNLPRRPGQPGRQRRTKRVTAQGVKRARAALQEWLAELLRHNCTDSQRITLGEVLRRWLEQSARYNARPKTRERYAELIEQHIVPVLGDWPVSALKPADLANYYERKQVDGRLDGKGGLAPQTVHGIHAVIRAALTWAEDEELVTNNPARRAKHPPASASHNRSVWTAGQIAQAMQETARHRVRIPLALAAWTGMRRGEVCALRWEDIDFDSAVLTVRQSLEQTSAKKGDKILHFGPPKSKRSLRTLPMPSRLIEILKEEKRSHDAMRLACGPAWNERGLVYCRANGEPVKPDSLTTSWQQFVHQHHLEPIEFHGLRRTYLSALHSEGAPDRLVMDRAGHGDMETTAKHYLVTFSAMDKEILRRQEAAIEAAFAELEMRQSSAGEVVSLAKEREKRRQ